MFSRILKLPDEVRTAVRHVEPRDDHPRRGPVPGAGQGGDHRVARTDRRRVLRRHRGQRVHVLHQRGVARPQGHRRQADPRQAADPRRRRQRAPDGRDGDGVVRGGDQLHVLPRRGEDGREPRRVGPALDGRRRRVRRRRRLPLPHRPQDVHDHQRWREHLSAGGREPARHPPQGARRGGHRRPQRRPRRGGEGGRAADRRRRRRRRARARAARVLPGAPRPLQVPAHRRLRGRAAPAAYRQALQAAAPRPLLGRHRSRASSDQRRSPAPYRERMAEPQSNAGPTSSGPTRRRSRPSRRPPRSTATAAASSRAGGSAGCPGR